MITLTFIALFTLASAAVALSLRNLIHSALLLIASWAGIAGFYLWAGAEFVAFAQVLVYVGAISMVVLFAVLLTRHSRADIEIAPDSQRRVLGAILAGGAVLGGAGGSAGGGAVGAGGTGISVDYYALTLTADASLTRTVAAAGTILIVDVTQDGIGGWDLTPDADFEDVESPLDIAVTASARTTVTFYSTGSKWRKLPGGKEIKE